MEAYRRHALSCQLPLRLPEPTQPQSRPSHGPAIPISPVVTHAGNDLMRFALLDVNGDGMHDLHFINGTGSATTVDPKHPTCDRTVFR